MPGCVAAVLSEAILNCGTGGAGGGVSKNIPGTIKSADLNAALVLTIAGERRAAPCSARWAPVASALKIVHAIKYPRKKNLVGTYVFCVCRRRRFTAANVSTIGAA